MSRIPLVDPTTATGDARATLNQIHGAFGATPAMFRLVANSPAALKSMWGSFGALGGGQLPAKLGEQIAVAIAERNGCEYCLSAHTALGRKAGASAQDMTDAQLGRSADAKSAAAIKFALQLLERRGRVDSTDVDTVRKAGFDDGAIVEIVAHVALNVYTNYVNNALGTPNDFPAVEFRKAS